MARPLLLDLFCGAGGAAMGYHRAGFDVIGVDILPQPRYPFTIVQADAAVPPVDLTAFDLIHASPPCQDYSRALRHLATKERGKMIGAVRALLATSGRPWVIENVPGADMRVDYRLCGCMFGLPRLKRERWFETSWHGFDLRVPCLHVGPVVRCIGGGGLNRSMAERRSAMGIDWMTRAEISQAIPPAYTEYIGKQLLAHLGGK